MDAPALPAALDSAVEAYDKARDAFYEAVETWLMGELAALSAHLKNRTVTLYSGNGAVSLHIERRRPLTSGDYNARKAFEVGEHYSQGWARWLPAPDLFATLAEVEQQTEFDWITPIGAFKFRNGERLDAEAD
jgi:hypothetical protein